MPLARIPQRLFVATLLFVGSVVSIISSLGAPLIPSIAEDLDASLSSAQWSLTATMLVGAVASPIVGRLGDGRHRRAVVLACLGAVLAGCVMAALAESLAVLVAGRALQGAGLALIPLTMAAARDHLPARRSPGVIAVLSVIAAVGVGLGYPVTGFIAEHADLAACFWAGAAMTAAALLMAAIAIPKPSDDTPPRPLDLVGAALIAIGLVALLVGIEKGPDWGWTSTRTLGLLAVAAALLAGWTRYEQRVAEPLVDLRLARHRAVLTANVSGLALGVAMYLSIALITQLVQLPPAGGGLGESVFVAGLTLLPLSVGSFLASRCLPLAHERLGARAIVPLGAVAVGVAALFFAATATRLWEVFVTLGMVGVGLGFSFAALPGLIVRAVPPAETGSATGFYQVARYVGFSVGSGLSVTLVRSFDSAGASPLDAFRWTFVVGAALCALTAVLAWVLPGDRLESRRLDPELERLEVEEGLLGAAGLEVLDADRRPV
ncbi:MAG TPA: MFS transporter [Capillimicrobium sp.]|nr:MFS transporter [Capillimicrobium sp.]